MFLISVFKGMLEMSCFFVYFDMKKLGFSQCSKYLSLKVDFDIDGQKKNMYI